MRVWQSSAIAVVLYSVAIACSTPTRAQQGKNAPPPPPATGTIKTSTRLITVDVVATDSRGNAVRDLKQEDFQVTEEHGAQQRIVRFEFVDTLANARAAGGMPPKLPPYMFSNVQSVPMNLPPTVILMDALNTEIIKQMQVRRDMLLFLTKLPPDTPVAVFLLGHSLHIVQNFTTDPSLLVAAVNQSGHSLTSAVQPMPQDDASNVSNTLRNFGTNTPESVLQSLEDFESQEYQMVMDQRVRETADAMKSIAKFLGGYSGRKNLIWFSESFPIWIEPTTEFGSNPFSGSTSYSGKVREAAYALTDAQVAVYPVDARALEGPGAYSAANGFNRQTMSGPGFAGALSREDSLRIDSQDTMDEVAESTGGRTCKNTNDLAGCVKSALDQSSSYYELAYYPQDTRWDGRFHKITVKSPVHGIKLAYRRGYFATDAAAIAQKEKPEKLLQQACMEALPGTSIAFTAQAVAPDNTMPPDETRYILNIPTAALSLAPADGQRALNLKLAICEYAPKGDSFQLYTRDLSRPVPEPVYESWKARGMRDLFDYQAKPENQRLRFAVLDVPSGQIGAIDVPAHPQRYGALPAPTVPGDVLARAAAPSSPPPPAPAPAAPSATPPPAAPPPTHIQFRVASGASSMLDWGGASVSYHGDLSIDQGAHGLFTSVFGAYYHCEGGMLMTNDVTSNAKPNLIFTFRKPDGTRAAVDLAGGAPAYSGEVPVDSSARALFDYVWKLVHCQQP